MSDVNALLSLLQGHLRWHRARLFMLAALVLAVLRLRSVCLARLAPLVSPLRSNETNYRRLQRFFQRFEPDYDALAQLLLALAPADKRLLLALDRTEWDIGRRRVNLLVVAYVWDGMAVPLLWRELDKKGTSNQDERIALLDRLLKILPAERIEALIADREFMGSRFLSHLDTHGVGFVIRLRRNTRLRYQHRDQRVDSLFPTLAPGGRHRTGNRQRICGVMAHLVAAQQGEEPWFLVTNVRPSKAIDHYRARWSIETMFGAMKSRGFDLEATHLSASDRLEKLVAVLALALLWALKVGLWKARQQAIGIKKHGRKARSLFRYGLDHLQKALFSGDWTALRPFLNVLSCT